MVPARTIVPGSTMLAVTVAPLSLASLPLSLIFLPIYVLEHLTLFLTVPSLQRLAVTCSFFEKFIHGRRITNLEIPFTPAFLQELNAATSIDKKPVLRITCAEVLLADPPTSPMAMALSLAITSLDRLRDLVLLPDTNDVARRRNFRATCLTLLNELASGSRLQRLTRLELPVSVLMDFCYFHNNRICFHRPPCYFCPEEDPAVDHISLHSLNLFVSDSEDLQKMKLLILVLSTKFLAITVLPEARITKKMRLEVYDACESVEKVEVRGPCSLQLRLDMLALREVTTVAWDTAAPCTSTQLAEDDRAIHRTGSCGVDVRRVWGDCPLLTCYNGITLEAQGVKVVGEEDLVMNQLGQSFSKWMAVSKKAFYADYRRQGGEKDLQAWAKARWSGRQLKK